MRILANILRTFKVSSRESCKITNRRYSSQLCPRIRGSTTSVDSPALNVVCVRSFTTTPADCSKGGSSSSSGTADTFNTSSTAGNSTDSNNQIIPVALLKTESELDSSPVKVLVIPINLFNNDKEAVQKTMSTMSVIRANADQIDAFTDNAAAFATKTNAKNTNVFGGPKRRVEEPLWQDFDAVNEGIIINDGLNESIAEHEINRIRPKNSFDALEWNDSKAYIIADVPPNLEKRLGDAGIASMDLAFEMDMTNIKDALLMRDKLNEFNEFEDTVSMTLRDPLISMTTSVETDAIDMTTTVPLSFNALIQGTVNIDSSKLTVKQIEDMKVPQFNDYVTSMAANICSTALQKGFPTDVSRMYSTKTTTSDPPKRQKSPHVVCERQGDKGCISPGNADLDPYVPKGSRGSSSSNNGNEGVKQNAERTCKCTETSLLTSTIIGDTGARGLMSCKAYAIALKEAERLRELFAAAKAAKENNCNFYKAEKVQAPTAPKCQPPKQEKKCQPPKQEKKCEAPKAEKKCQPPNAEKSEPLKAEMKSEAPQAEKKSEPPKAEMKCEAPQAEKKCEAPPQAEKKCEAPPQAEKKCEAPPQAEKKCEAPPQAEKKCEAPQQAEKKCEAPQQAEKKCEAPQQAEKKCEAPQQAEKKCEAPQQAEKKCEAPPQAEKKCEAPPQAEKKCEAPPQAEKKCEAPPQAEKKCEAPPQAEIKSEPLIVEMKSEAPKAEKKCEPPKAEKKCEPPKAEKKCEPPKAEKKCEPPKAEKKCEPAKAEIKSEPPKAEKKCEPAKAEIKSEPPKAEKKCEPPKAEIKSEPPKVEKKCEPAKAEIKSEPPKAEKKCEPAKAEIKSEPPKAEKKCEPPKAEKKCEPPKAEKKCEPPKAEKKCEPPKAEKKCEPPKAEKKCEPPKAEKKCEPPKAEKKCEPPKAEKKCEPPKAEKKCEPAKAEIKGEPALAEMRADRKNPCEGKKQEANIEKCPSLPCGPPKQDSICKDKMLKEPPIPVPGHDRCFPQDNPCPKKADSQSAPTMVLASSPDDEKPCKNMPFKCPLPDIRKEKDNQKQLEDNPCQQNYPKQCPPKTSVGDCKRPIVDPCSPKGGCIKKDEDKKSPPPCPPKDPCRGTGGKKAASVESTAVMDKPQPNIAAVADKPQPIFAATAVKAQPTIAATADKAQPIIAAVADSQPSPPTKPKENFTFRACEAFRKACGKRTAPKDCEAPANEKAEIEKCAGEKKVDTTKCVSSSGSGKVTGEPINPCTESRTFVTKCFTAVAAKPLNAKPLSAKPLNTKPLPLCARCSAMLKTDSLPELLPKEAKRPKNNLSKTSVIVDLCKVPERRTLKCDTTMKAAGEGDKKINKKPGPRCGPTKNPSEKPPESKKSDPWCGPIKGGPGKKVPSTPAKKASNGNGSGSGCPNTAAEEARSTKPNCPHKSGGSGSSKSARCFSTLFSRRFFTAAVSSSAALPVTNVKFGNPFMSPLNYYSSKSDDKKKGGSDVDCPAFPPRPKSRIDIKYEKGLKDCFTQENLDDPCSRPPPKDPNNTACNKKPEQRGCWDDNENKLWKRNLSLLLNQGLPYSQYRRQTIGTPPFRMFSSSTVLKQNNKKYKIREEHEESDNESTTTNRTRQMSPTQNAMQKQLPIRQREIDNEIVRIGEAGEVLKVSESIQDVTDYDVLVRVGAIALSGSDIHVYETGGDKCTGITIGHDATGIVEKVGKCVDKLKPGDCVAMESGLCCGICDVCKQGNYNLCPQLFHNGFFSTHQTHPADLCHKIPDNVTLEDATLTSILALGLQACFKAEITPTTSVLVMGTSPKACAAALCARALGAKSVAVMAPNVYTLESIRILFDFDYIHYYENESNLMEKLTERVCTVLKDRPNVVINYAISESSMNMAISLLKPGGKCVLAECDNEYASFNAMDVLMKSISLVTSFRSANMFPAALSLLKSGKTPIGELVSRIYTWDQIKWAFHWAQYEANMGNRKVIVQGPDLLL